ncbi:non-homologous end-joining DNA ligase [Chelativorans alearense]|uniref:non-homologous end-joining DNA ligase n=1 Tax=Chelativorans alearense TaxID=2681495 RepID=UPI00196A1151|nr:non-homologous end-joining DNA ligase [Chelativorans alearense]
MKPALATLVDDVPSGGNWLFETKFDGYRALSAVSGSKVRIYTRSGLDWTDRFHAIADALAELDLRGVLLDGEVVALDSAGRSSFSDLQKGLRSGGKNLSYFVFDLLAVRNKSIRSEPLSKRKARLKSLLKEAGREGPIFYTDHVNQDGAAMLEMVCRSGYEGIIAKRASARYRSGRGRIWLKIKCGHEQEFVVVGWSPSQKNRPFASLLLGVYEKGDLQYAGRVGTGFSQDELQQLGARLNRLSRRTPPVTGGVPRAIAKDARWVTPQLVAQVAFTELTADGLVRQARFLGLREDKPAENVSWEESEAE